MDEEGSVKFQIIAGEIAIDFINTLDNRAVPERQQELLLTYQHLIAWAKQAGAIRHSQYTGLHRQAEIRPDEAEAVLRGAVELRECLYHVMESVLKKRPAPAEDLAAFSGILGEALSRVQMKPVRPGRGYRLDWDPEEPDLQSVLWPIVRSASTLLTSPDLAYLRECGDHTCRWMFVDRSKNHSRHWCDMKICGNRMKARKFYRRQRSASHHSKEIVPENLRD